MFCLTYEKLHILNLKKNRRAFYDEARTTETTRDHGDTVLSFAYDYPGGVLNFGLGRVCRWDF